MLCIVCNTLEAQRERTGDAVFYTCDRCGTFELTGSAEQTLPHELNAAPLRRALMSYALRRMQKPNNQHLKVISTYDLASFWQNRRLPTPQEQADSLILWIGDSQPSPEDAAEIKNAAIAAWIGANLPRPGNPSEAGMLWLDEQLKEKDLYRRQQAGDKSTFKLTLAGWERYSALKKSNIESRRAFMAMKFGDPDLNRAVDECFRPAVRRAGFELRVVTDQQRAGSIDDQIRAAILASRFVLSDLTHGSPGAYWEAGFGEGLGLPVIYTCEKSVWDRDKTHFDTNHLLTIIWESTDLKNAENALTATIRATLRAEAKQIDE
jgi:hypothetical protein